MALDIIGYINTAATNLTTGQKVSMLDDFGTAHGYKDIIEGQPNPQTKKEFANAEIVKFIKLSVDRARERAAKAAVSFDALNLE